MFVVDDGCCLMHEEKKNGKYLTAALSPKGIMHSTPNVLRLRKGKQTNIYFRPTYFINIKYDRFL